MIEPSRTNEMWIYWIIRERHGEMIEPFANEWNMIYWVIRERHGEMTDSFANEWIVNLLNHSRTAWWNDRTVRERMNCEFNESLANDMVKWSNRLQTNKLWIKWIIRERHGETTELSVIEWKNVIRERHFVKDGTICEWYNWSDWIRSWTNELWIWWIIHERNAKRSNLSEMNELWIQQIICEYVEMVGSSTNKWISRMTSLEK